MKKNRCILLAVPMVLGSLAMAAEAGPKVVFADLTWDEPRAINAVLGQLLTTHFDAEIDSIAADQAAIFAAMGLGDGTADVHSAVWIGAQKPNVDRYVDEEGTVKLNKVPYVADDGFYVPRYMAEKHNLKTVQDMLNPEVAALFDVNGDGRPDFWPGAPGWGVTNVQTVKAKSYGMNEYYDLLVASDALLKAQLESTVQKEEGMFFYYWSPEALFNSYDLVKLEEPAFTGFSNESMKDDPDYNPEGCYNFIQPVDDPDWLGKSEITCATPGQPVYVAYSSALEERAPEIARFLGNISITAEEVSGWIYESTTGGKSSEEMASEWIAAHPDRVETWLNAGK